MLIDCRQLGYQSIVPNRSLQMLINFKQATKIKPITQKSHTCGANFRISVWHLFMNLKNNYLLKKTVEVGQTKM